MSSPLFMLQIQPIIDDKLREFEDIYHKFNVFSDEFLDSCETEHSHQSTSAEFLRFEEEYKHSIVPSYNV